MKKLLLVFSVLCTTLFYAQDDSIFDRLSVLYNNGKTWYNIDGYSITNEYFSENFDEKGLRKVFRKHQITDKDPKRKLEKLGYHHWVVEKTQKIMEGFYQTSVFYFIENADKKINVIWFIKAGNRYLDMEEALIKAIMEDKIPQENIVSMRVEHINFAGRKVELSDCEWRALNTINCPYQGMMNWSIHKDLDDAKRAVEHQYEMTKSRNSTKIVEEKWQEIEFEGVDTKAKRIKIDIKGVNSLLAGMSGGKYLIVYYIAENVRGRNVSSVFSFWDNDDINPNTSLPPLLEKFIKLK